MLTLLNKAFVDGIPAEFESPWPIDETRARLARLTRWQKDATPIVGNVTEQSVKLAVLHMTNSNGTAFRGQIGASSGQVVLSGAFAASAYQRIVGLLMLAFVSLVALSGLTTMIRSAFESTDDLGSLFQTLAGAAVFVLVSFGFALLVIWQASPSRRDVAKLTSAIQSALNN